jgi:hypothetical protein
MTDPASPRVTMPEEIPEGHDPYECLLKYYKMGEGDWVRKLDRLYLSNIVLIFTEMVSILMLGAVLYVMVEWIFG